MRKGKLVTKKVVETDDVICDRCGKSCMKVSNYPNIEAATLTAEWGYGTSKDGIKWKAEICETCADEFKEWVIDGPGPGMLVEEYAQGDYQEEGMLERINYYANEDLGLSGTEFLTRLASGDDFGEYPAGAISKAYYLAEAYFHYQEKAKQ